MYRTILLLLCGIMLALLATACPRDKEGTDAPQTDVDVTVNTDDKSTSTDTSADSTDASGARDAGDTASGDTAAETPADAAADGTTPADGTATDTPPADTPPAAGTTRVELTTTKGKIVLEVHPEWAPLGAARFLELVNAKFYDGAPIFRVVPDFMMQTGLAADPALNAEWSAKRIPDDPMVPGVSNTTGMVSFAMAGPNTRTTQFFINFVDRNSFLDSQGFSPFAKVVEGMDVVNSIFKTGENTNNEQGLLQQPGGLDKVKAIHPEMDFITSAKVLP
ncbi:peptidylprolyl isomerase [bacterium]|nr:peptidylprolyl isomerase [bacterium]